MAYEDSFLAGCFVGARSAMNYLIQAGEVDLVYTLVLITRIWGRCGSGVSTKREQNRMQEVRVSIISGIPVFAYVEIAPVLPLESPVFSIVVYNASCKSDTKSSHFESCTPWLGGK